MEPLFRVETDRVTLTWSAGRGGARAPVGAIGPPGRVRVRARRADARVALSSGEGRASGAETTVAGDGLRLFEQTDYRVVARATAGGRVEIAHRDPVVVRDLTPEDGGRLVLGLVNFGNQIGTSELAVLVDGRPELDVELEVFPSKLDYATDYERIVAEVQEILTGLAVEYLRATFRLGRPTAVARPTHVEWLSLLAGVAGDLERALDEIARRPSRAISRAPERVRAERVTRVDSQIRSLLRKGAGAGAPLHLAPGLHVRERLTSRPPRQTLDTPEHRWIARELRAIARRIASLRREEAHRTARRTARRMARQHDRGAPSARGTQTLDELAALESRIARLERLEPIASAAGAPPARFASLRLLSAPGYREAYRALLLLSLGLSVEGGPARFSLKDLSLLYEYWCYLSLLGAVADALGAELPARELFRVSERGLHVDLARGRETAVELASHAGRRVVVRYNPLFAGGAVLVPQRPDMVVTLEDPDWPRLHLLLDAKYRVDASPEYVERYGSPGPPEDAINVLHRYRDAILEVERDRPERTVVHAAAVFPFREPEPGAYGESRLWRELARLGVGAIPLLPGADDYLRAWVRAALEHGGWALADRTIPHRTRERARDMGEAARDRVVVGLLRGEDPAGHLAWIGEQQRYYTPYRRSRYEALEAKRVAIYSPASIRAKGAAGAITHAADVERIEIVRRAEIATPWLASRSGDELFVLYHLGALSEIARPIENRDARRPAVARWTSRLALERARSLGELGLETEAAWRLYEEASARGLSIRIERSGARVWLVAPSGARAREAGSGYEVVSVDGALRRYDRASEAAAALG